MLNKNFSIPKEVLIILETLQKNSFDAYVVGGCVRDIFLGRKPNDWDVTTNASPEEIKKIFPKSFYENRFFTVTVLTVSEEKNLKEIEVTTYRTESTYSDKRRPDEVQIAKNIEEDLSRRDFTVNAMALDIEHKIIDPFGGQDDLKRKIIRTVGNPDERFYEDALRMMRAVRFAIQLDFTLEQKTVEAIRKHAASLEHISKERIRDEFMKILGSGRAYFGVVMLEELDLLQYILPELREGISVGQNLHHKFTVWEHNLKALEWACRHHYSGEVKLAALLHDVAKPRCKRGDGLHSTFYSHDVAGAKMARAIMRRLKFSSDEIEKITTLVRWHLFKYDPDEGITDSAIRRLVRNVGDENMNDLVLLRIADRMGSGVAKAVPYRLRHFQYRVEKIFREEEKPTLKMLKINGDILQKELGMKPSPKIGLILNALFEEVIDDTKKNNKEYLFSRAKEMIDMSDEDLRKFADSAKHKVALIEDERDEEMKQKHWVK